MKDSEQLPVLSFKNGIFLFLVLHFYLLLFVYPEGHLTWDSGTYHLMANTLLNEGSFFIKNGYDLLPSPLFQSGQLVVPNGKLVSQYPEFYTFLALPFYALFGFKGFAFLNSLALFANCVLLHSITKWFSDKKRIQNTAVTIYLFCTFSWEYAFSSYPHLTSTFFILLSCRLAWSVYLDKPLNQNVIQSKELRLLLSGLIFGIAIGVRLDSVFLGPALFLPLLHGRGIFIKETIALALGSLLPLLLLSWINYIKFGTLSPFSYGREASSMSLKMYLPFMILLFFIGALIAYRDLLGKHKKKVILLSSFLFLTIMFMPFHYFTSNPVLNTGSIIEGLWQLLFDMRIRPEIAESALSRSDNGSVLYFQNVKKALFQSMPFLVLVLLVPFLQRNGRRDKRLILLILPATYIGIYGAQAWHGSVATNMRYFLPTLPFLIIYFVVSFENIFTKKLSVFYIFVLAAVWLLLVITFLRIGRNIWLQEAIILNGSLTLIFALLVNFAFIQIKPEKIQQSIFGVLIFCSLTWSSALVFSRDMVFSLSVRNTFASISKEILPHIPTRSLLLVESPDWVWPIIDRNDKSIIATFENVDCDDLATVVKKFHSTHYLYLITYRESHLNYQSEKCFPIDIDNQSFQTISINLTPHSDFLVKAISNSSE